MKHNTLRITFAAVFLASALLASCGGTLSTPTSRMPQPKPLVTEVPSSVPQPTSTSTPVASPTPMLPVNLGEVLPKVGGPISTNNSQPLTLLAKYEPYVPPPSLVMLAPNGEQYYVASPSGIDIYDAKSRQTIKHYDIVLSEYFPYDFQLATNGDRFLVHLNSNELGVFNTSDGKKLFSYMLPSDGVGTFALSPDGKNLAVDICSDCNGYKGEPKFNVIEIDTGKVIYEYKSGSKMIRGWYPVFSPDGKTVATQSNSQVVLWSSSNWDRVATLGNAFYIFERVVFSSDSTIAAIIDENAVSIWSMEDNKRLRVFTACGDAFRPPQVRFSSDNTYIAILSCGKLDVLKTADGSLISEESADVSTISGIGLSTDGIPTIYKVDLKGNKVYAPWNSWDSLSGLEFSESESSLQLNFVSLGNPGNACSITMGQMPNCAEGDFIMGSDGKFYNIVSTTANKFELRSGVDSSGETIISFKWAGESFQADGFDPKHNLLFNTNFLYAGQDGFYVRDVTNGQIIKRVNFTVYRQNSIGARIKYSPDGNFAAFYFDTTGKNSGSLFNVFDLASREVKFQLTNIGASAFSPDGKILIAFTGSSQITKKPYTIVDLEKYTESSSYPTLNISTTNLVTDAHFSPDGSILAIGYNDGSIQLLNTKDGSSISQWTTNGYPISSLTFTQDSKYLASASDDGTIQIWGVYP